MRRLLLVCISVGCIELLYSLPPADFLKTFVVNNRSNYSVYIILSVENPESFDDKEIADPIEIPSKQKKTIKVTNPFIKSFSTIMHIKTTDERLRIAEKQGTYPLETVTIGNPKGEFFWEQNYPVYGWGDKLPEELYSESSDEE